MRLGKLSEPEHVGRAEPVELDCEHEHLPGSVDKIGATVCDETE
jgi:hypothetical protein